jgi:hypothetical protein
LVFYWHCALFIKKALQKKFCPSQVAVRRQHFGGKIYITVVTRLGSSNMIAKYNATVFYGRDQNLQTVKIKGLR